MFWKFSYFCKYITVTEDRESKSSVQEYIRIMEFLLFDKSLQSLLLL